MLGQLLFYVVVFYLFLLPYFFVSIVCGDIIILFYNVLLQSIRKSECPKELEPADRRSSVHVNLVRRDQKCPVSLFLSLFSYLV